MRWYLWAEVAARFGYVKPLVDDGDTIEIKEGRHPVVERFLHDESFVPNDVRLEADAQRVIILTGPNMSGKSVFVRQVALIVLLAQIGSFVPASYARLGLIDRIFTRVGASDDIAQGRSTFLVEMSEASHRAMSRIGDGEAVPLLLQLLSDPDSTVTRDAAFALGLLRDPDALPTLRDVVATTPPEQQHEMHAEAMRAVLRTGGTAAADILAEVLNPWVARASSSVPPLTVEAGLWVAWRLGQDAPVAMLVEFVGSPVVRNRLGALYSLGRLRAPAGAAALLASLGDADPEIRRVAARALTAAYADTAGLDRIALATQIRRLVGDDDAQVRANALRSLGTFRDSTLSPAVLDRLADSDPGVRVQAIEVLADLGGSASVAAVAERPDPAHFTARGGLGTRRIPTRSPTPPRRWHTLPRPICAKNNSASMSIAAASDCIPVQPSSPRPNSLISLSDG